MEKLIKHKRWIYLGLGLAVLAATLFPLFALRIDLLGPEISMEFSLRTLFQNVGGSSGDFPLGDLGQFGQNDFVRAIIMPFAAYLLMLVLVVIGTVFAFFDKFKVAINVLLVGAVGLAVYVGFGLMNLPAVFGDAVMEMLGNNPLMGFFASMLNISEMITINLGVGYWLTLAFLIAFVVVKFTLEFVKKKDD